MKKKHISRREFVKSSAILAAALPITPGINYWASPAAADKSDSASLHWLAGQAPVLTGGATWGVPWPKGKYKPKTQFSLSSTEGQKIAVQSWPLAYWPDGSLKWTAHAIAADAGLVNSLKLSPGKGIPPQKPVRITENNSSIQIDTGVINCVVEKEGSSIISSISRDGKKIATDGRLVLMCQDRNEPDEEGTIRTEHFSGKIKSVTLEQSGPVRAVVRVEGEHASKNRTLLPFTLRLYFYSGAESVRIMHTIIYDADENKDFLKGIGMRFNLPMKDELHNRHVRFAGEDNGIFAEAVKGLSGLRNGNRGSAEQVKGLPVPPLPNNGVGTLEYIPAFGDYTLFQPNADSFEIRKRTANGHFWLNSAYGNRASGLGYFGSPTGGMAFAIRNFWQSHPTQLDIRKGATDSPEVTMWIWGPDSPAMDLRFYHDGLGQDTYGKQLDALKVTYEDYEPGFGTPDGVGRTSEMFLWILPATPSAERLREIAAAAEEPPMLMCEPAYLQKMQVFGGAWCTPETGSPAKAAIEKQLDWYFNFYKSQVDERKWYGFWNYGDVMHSYDESRHTWKYDIGGFAWDNSELSTDLWLWYYFLRTGRADVFKMAEAMTRHTGEVDVYHQGKFFPLGTRHNVMHWGCSAKQLRISNATNRRIYYYLSADERVGDLMREQVDAHKTLTIVQPERKVTAGRVAPGKDSPSAMVSFGTDWGALCGAWFTEWERTGDKKTGERLLNSMRTIAAQPNGFFTYAAEMELDTGTFKVDATNKTVRALHLSSVFGLVEICTELIHTVKMPEFEKAWLQYCEVYNATPEEQEAVLGKDLGKLNLRQGHSRLTAWAAKYKGDSKLAARAWNEFYTGSGGIIRHPLETIKISGPDVITLVHEAPGVSTNGVAQWGLAAMQVLALVGDKIPER